MNLREKLEAIRRQKIRHGDELDEEEHAPAPKIPEPKKISPKPVPAIAEEAKIEPPRKLAEAPRKIVEEEHEAKPVEPAAKQVEIAGTAEVETKSDEEHESRAPPKSIPALAEEIIREKKEEHAAFPEGLLEEIEKEEKQINGEAQSRPEGAGEAEKEKQTPRKSIPAIAEEIRREKGIAEPAREQNAGRAPAGKQPGAPGLPPPPPPPYLTSPIPTEMIERIAEAKQTADTPSPKRLYLLPPEERKKLIEERKAVEEEEKQTGIPSRRGGERLSPEQEGFESMVSEVYVQIRKEEEKLEPQKEKEKLEERERLKREKEEKMLGEIEERKRLREQRKAAQEPPKEEAAPPVVSEVSIEDILGGKGREEAKVSGVFGELDKQAGGGGKSLFNKLEEAAGDKKQAEFTEVSKEKGCPNCKAAGTKIVYCPFCGGAMCATCAANVAAYPDHFTYTCPHCGEEVEVKRKAG